MHHSGYSKPYVVHAITHSEAPEHTETAQFSILNYSVKKSVNY